MGDYGLVGTGPASLQGEQALFRSSVCFSANTVAQEYPSTHRRIPAKLERDWGSGAGTDFHGPIEAMLGLPFDYPAASLL
ncbi:hypothetical protein GGI21_004024, partial [Coemansia aciculifera]